jgi:methionyl-tRNA formyltransferase
MEDQKLSMILMGTGPFAVPSFEAIRAAGHPISLIVTRPQPPVKSRKGPPPSPVRDWATKHDFVIFDPTSINDAEPVDRLSNLNPDLLVVCDYGQILKPAALESARLGGINLHGSLLPKYRGAAPVQWSMLSGDTVTGVSVIHMTPRLDGGPILTTRETAISEDETAGELEERLSTIGVDATMEAIGMLSDWDGSATIGKVQDTNRATKAPRLTKSDGQIDWSRTAREIDCHVRGMQPWPVAFTELMINASKPPLRLAIKETSISESPSAHLQPGELVLDDGLGVATADRVIRILRLQPSGKKEMQGAEFLRGHQLAAGTRLG